MRLTMKISFTPSPKFLCCALAPLAISLLVFGPVSTAAHAQGLGSIVGTVVDPSGAAVTGVKVTAMQSATGVKVDGITNDSGGYVFPALPPTNYDLTFSAPGFSTSTQRGVVLLADQAVTVNVSLKVGVATTSVTVTTEASQVDTTTGTLSQVVESARVNELPLNGRNAAQLTTLTAGINVAPNVNGIDQGNTKTFPVDDPDYIERSAHQSDQLSA